MMERDVYAEIAAATMAGDVAKLAALAMEMAGQAAALERRRSSDRGRKRQQRAAQEVTRSEPSEPAPASVPSSHGTSRDITGQGVTSGDTLSPLVPPFPLPEPNPLPPYNPPSPEKISPERPARSAYPAEFEAVWAVYPKRAGDNPKRGAFRAWQASIRRGADQRAMLDGTHRYAKFCEATNLLGTVYVKQGATFFGPNESWLDPWDIPLRVERGGAKREPEPQYDDPNAPGYVGLIDGEMSPMMRRLSQPRAS